MNKLGGLLILMSILILSVIGIIFLIKEFGITMGLAYIAMLMLVVGVFIYLIHDD